MVPQMSFFLAAVWSITALFALDLAATLLISVAQGAEFDLVSRVLCQAIAFLGTLFALLQLHERERTTGEALAFRRTSPWLLLLALILGALAQGPLGLMTDAIYRRFPLPQAEVDMLTQLFTVPKAHQKVALVIAAGIVGPVVEEMFFRGAILGALRKTHSTTLSVVGSSLLFAAAHRDLRNLGPDFLAGLLMGYVRVASGSLWPAILVHGAFNTISVIFAVRSGPEGEVFTTTQSIIAAGATAVVLALFRVVAKSASSAEQARGEDARGGAML